MKASDICIGDWVNYKSPSSGKLHPIKIENIYGAEFNCEIEDWNIISGKSISDTEPIELTEEILAKNGFEKFAESQTLFDYTDNDIHLEYWIGDGCFRYYTAEIHYVHQLQHLLRLCGIEKEIVID